MESISRGNTNRELIQATDKLSNIATADTRKKRLKFYGHMDTNRETHEQDHELRTEREDVNAMDQTGKR